MIYIEDLQTQTVDSQEGTTTQETTIQENVPAAADNTQPEPVTQQSEDSFFDPNNVPEELKPVYKGMQSAYTKKTQELANQRKELDAYKTKAEQFDKYQSHIQRIEEIERSRTDRTPSPEMQALEQKYREAGYSDEAIDMMKMGLEFTLNHFNQTLSAKDRQNWIDSQIEQAAKIDPRLTDTSLVYKTEDGETVTYGQMVESIASSDPDLGKDIVAATKRAIKRVDALIGKAKTEGKEELSQAAKAKAAKFPSNTSSPQSTSDAEVKGSIRDIGRQTAAELGIKL